MRYKRGQHGFRGGMLADVALTKRGAYGSSSNVQATASSLFRVGGIVTNHMELKNNKDNGTLLPVKTTYYIVTTKRYTTLPGEDGSLLPDHAKSDPRRYVKQHNVKWNRRRHHLLLDFLKSYLTNEKIYWLLVFVACVACTNEEIIQRRTPEGGDHDSPRVRRIRALNGHG